MASSSQSYHSPNKKLMRQKQCRRKTNLMKKAYEYSKMCDADVCVGIRLRETGQVYILSSDASGFWAFLNSQLGSHYPAPKLIPNQDMEKAKDGTNRALTQDKLDSTDDDVLE
ncbi:hypothetical protein NUU61_001417 [Penicillium alfredii]|uniref:MADS-box domain-containing protein n=1 Tax=Penicillium alfredii TaxID=1506179 RepID=A0A9W9G5P9_9EURO|nr:uncharacterized protein NUU61_001417 [Penicillium alfredii]KAJ5111787.1 hypothetical protein NUU61_001417 [Penicillium alfredii]